MFSIDQVQKAAEWHEIWIHTSTSDVLKKFMDYFYKSSKWVGTLADYKTTTGDRELNIRISYESLQM